MVQVFSFCIFGANPKYCTGLLRNIELIKEYFPDWEIWVYKGDAVPSNLEEQLQKETAVRVIPTGKSGMVNKVYRFFPIDTLDVDICIVRDTDSRVHARDRECIKDFIKSEMKFHIIRDHPNNFHKIMAGMFGIKRGCLSYKIQEAYERWKQDYKTDEFWDDTYFLVDVIYPDVKFQALVHDEYHSHEPEHFKSKIQIPVDDSLEFIGQAYDFDKEGNQFTLHKLTTD